MAEEVNRRMFFASDEFLHARPADNQRSDWRHEKYIIFAVQHDYKNQRAWVGMPEDLPAPLSHRKFS